MSRPFSTLPVALLAVLVVTAGCAPQQPFYFFEDGDLSHYIEKATEIEYPDVDSATLDEVTGAIPPMTLDNPDPSEIWELTLEEAVRITLDNSKVIRALSAGPFPQVVDTLQRTPEQASTVYDPALIETSSGFDQPIGVAAALAEFDAVFDSYVRWQKNDQPANVGGFGGIIFSPVREEDVGSFQAEITKTAATGGTWYLRHNVDYLWSNSPIRAEPSDWTVSLEAEFSQPLLQGNGVQFTRIYGPRQTSAAGSRSFDANRVPGAYRGVMIARLHTDTSLADFEGQVRNLVNDVERAYWELYFAYRQLDAYVRARDRALEAWREQEAALVAGGVQDRLGRTRGKKEDVALARHQVFQFRGLVEDSQSYLYSVEGNLRYIMGLAASDGRLIRPADEPTTAKVEFDWYEAHSESLVRSVHLRKQKWMIKQRELELIAAKNLLLPELNAGGIYRWRGLGDELIDPRNRLSNGYGSMTDGDFQEWQLGLNLSVPLGFRKELAEVRHVQLKLARERSVLQELELEVSHALQETVRDLDKNYRLCETYLNRRVAAEEELEVWEAIEDAGMTVDEDRRLLAQQRLAQAEVDYYRALKSYNLAIAQVHFRKGSLLEYNGVYLAEGPWPAKAYFDAHRQARARDAGLYLDYGFTRPKVISRGAYEQHAGTGGLFPDGEPTPASEGFPEVIPAPPPEPLEQFPAEPVPAEPQARSVLQKAGPESAELRLVKPVAYQEVGAGTESRQEGRAEDGWKSTKRSGAGHESVANPPTPATDRNASGWTGVQH
ncbi:MAG: hypothetical protein A2V98_19670 [Planctomycetes bacterium RBG_16_64_12]|nr:MAG: hypothetical protein A2V98_19670 [Planctomycetes bacterium RBG_16_64_12]